MRAISFAISFLFIEETSSLYSQRRGGVGSKFKLGKNEYVTTSTTCQNTDNLLFFTQKGNVYAYEAGALPIGEKIAVESLFAISTNEKVCAITNLSNSNPARHIVFITKNGMLKKSLLSEYNIKKAKKFQQKLLGLLSVQECCHFAVS